MGVIRPPWVPKDWFNRVPFNFCDHFGDKERLVLVCKICKQEMIRKAKYFALGKDPYENALEDVGKDLKKTLSLICKDAKKYGIDLENLPDVEENQPDFTSLKVYKVVKKYADQVERLIHALNIIPGEIDGILFDKAVDALVHSRHFICAKIYRALSSRWEELKDPEDDLLDSKTSAFFAYVAIERNSRALLALAKHRPLLQLKRLNLEFADVSVELASLIQDYFFPDDELEYEEFGCESYDKCFKFDR